jgi:hypothetical protein
MTPHHREMQAGSRNGTCGCRACSCDTLEQCDDPRSDCSCNGQCECNPYKSNPNLQQERDLVGVA